ncbi:MAG: LysM peptidoglycan-binding domain-containing protein [Chloroflexi bacterium]|nr:LysM peptidoglycan-binding domain-containing protein [Chloroflexota bacterium]
MTDRGLPLVDGAPACPFVAFEDDRDARATAPDHRHRCYAEVRPAPRALAHQEAYCLSSAFPVCPTFQDWARREAAQAKAAAAAAPHGDARPDDVRPDAARPSERPPAAGSDDLPPAGAAGWVPDSNQRNPPRSWAAPPPWLSSRDGEPDDDDEGDVAILPPARGGGLAGSFADRLAGGRADPPPSQRPAPPERWDVAGGDDEGAEGSPTRSPRSSSAGSASPRSRRSGRDENDPDAPALPGPSWERPRRLEAYPTLKTRMGLPSLSLPPLLVGVAALVLGAVALFFLPLLLGIGNDPQGGATSTPGASAAASASPVTPTPSPAPTVTIYVVQDGDNLQKIADRFGVTLAALLEANRDTITDPDVIDIGQEIIIPVAAPTTLPGVSPTPTPVT